MAGKRIDGISAFHLGFGCLKATWQTDGEKGDSEGSERKVPVLCEWHASQDQWEKPQNCRIIDAAVALRRRVH